MFFSSETECISWLAVLMVESVAIVTLNVFTIIVFMKNPSLRRRSTNLVINLAVVDMLVGGFSEFVNFFTTGATCNFWEYNVTEYGIWDNTLFSTEMLFPIASLTNITAISLERMHATFRPFRHRVIKKWVFRLIIAVIWVTSLLLSGIFYPREGTHLNYYLYLYIWSSFNFTCLFVICVSNVSIVVKMYCGARPQHHGAASRERKLTMTLLITTFVSLLMYMPIGIFVLVIAFIPDTYSSLSLVTFKRLNYSLFIVHYANSFVNPILYVIRMPAFKRALVSLFRCTPQQGQVVFPLRVVRHVNVGDDQH